MCDLIASVPNHCFSFHLYDTAAQALVGDEIMN